MVQTVRWGQSRKQSCWLYVGACLRQIDSPLNPSNSAAQVVVDKLGANPVHRDPALLFPLSRHLIWS